MEGWPLMLSRLQRHIGHPFRVLVSFGYSASSLMKRPMLLLADFAAVCNAATWTEFESHVLAI